jgi:REP element-mobilizing transposase RayT
MMSNHFHILVEIPEAPEDRGKSWSDEEFLRHVSIVYFGKYYRAIKKELTTLREERRDAEAEEFRDRFFARMWDLSRFMHDLKMRFAHWFNKVHDRDGHLWAEKFKSLLVESGHAARIVGAYIDLNPVRAGMVEDPKDYRWCGYAEALAGEERARQGVRMLFNEYVGESHGDRTGAEFAAGPWEELAAEYRKILYWDGEESDRDERKGRAGIARGKVEEVERKSGKINEMEMIRHRVRHFTDGLVIGSESFVEGVFLAARGYFGPRRKSGARKIRHAETSLRAMRDLDSRRSK